MFDLELSKEQKMIKEEVAKLVKDLVTEQAKEWDLNGDIPMETIQTAWDSPENTCWKNGCGTLKSPISTTEPSASKA